MAYNHAEVLKPICTSESKVKANSENEIIKRFKNEHKEWNKKYKSVPSISISVYGDKKTLMPLDHRVY